MASKTQVVASTEDANSTTQILAKIKKQVIDSLGEPDLFQRVQVRPLWENRYRANVMVGTGPVCVEVRHSYFVVADGSGMILNSMPTIERLY